MKAPWCALHDYFGNKTNKYFAGRRWQYEGIVLKFVLFCVNCAVIFACFSNLSRRPRSSGIMKVSWKWKCAKRCSFCFCFWFSCEIEFNTQDFYCLVWAQLIALIFANLQTVWFRPTFEVLSPKYQLLNWQSFTCDCTFTHLMILPTPVAWDGQEFNHIMYLTVWHHSVLDLADPVGNNQYDEKQQEGMVNHPQAS